MTEEELEAKEWEVIKNGNARDEFCEQVGITFDEFAIKQNGDFEIKDMLRAYYRGVERGSKI